MQLAMHSSGEVCVVVTKRDKELCLEKMLVLTLWNSINIKETKFQTTILNLKSLLKRYSLEKMQNVDKGLVLCVLPTSRKHIPAEF